MMLLSRQHLVNSDTSPPGYHLSTLAFLHPSHHLLIPPLYFGTEQDKTNSKFGDTRFRSIVFYTMGVFNRTLQARIGYTAGRGTGKELADVFERVIRHLSSRYSASIELQRSPRVFHSYNSLISDFGNQKDIERETMKDVKQYEDFCRTQAAQGTQVIFRTAINAQSLYLVRQHLQAVKVECFNQGENALLLVRDESQGFYTGTMPQCFRQQSEWRGVRKEENKLFPS